MRLFFPYLEWEVLREPVTITEVEDETELPKGQKRIVIDRDDNYNLRATLSFNSHLGDDLPKPSAVVGSFPEEFDIQGSYHDLVHYTLESCLIKNTTIRLAPEDKGLSNTADLLFNGLRMKTKNRNEGSRLTEWCLNGPRQDVFRRVTNRKLSTVFSRMRLAAKDDKIDSIEVSREGSDDGVDFVSIKAGDLQFLVAKAPKEVGPSWSSNIGIEYHKEWGRIPDVDEREKIEELCSFVFGRQFLSVGYTIYDRDNNVVEGYANNPWGQDARWYCSKQDKSPVRIDHFGGANVEDIIARLLPKYHELREPLRLKEALWLYWASRHVPIGTNLPILAAALESMMNGWYDNRSKSQALYMKKEEFESLLKEDIEAMKRKLESKPNGDKILTNILRAYSLGITERYRTFFPEIVLSIDANEWKAIEARHKTVHGHMIFDKTDWKQMIQHVNTFETLLNKVLLRLLGYSGTYIDRSVAGWNDRQLG
jgi:hypothetical protein